MREQQHASNFWAMVCKLSSSECWVWRGSKNEKTPEQIAQRAVNAQGYLVIGGHEPAAVGAIVDVDISPGGSPHVSYKCKVIGPSTKEEFLAQLELFGQYFDKIYWRVFYRVIAE